jgi:glyoxylase-like metal-dependent hydrolase (beta-lactamase superfamily II)
MIVLANTGGVAWTNCFLVADEASRQAVIFDAPDHTVTPLLDEARRRGLNVIGLWLTHGHFDHFADHAVVKKQFPNAAVLLHKLDAAKARNPDMQTRMFGLPFSIPPLEPDGHVEDDQELKIGSRKVQVLYTPGTHPAMSATISRKRTCSSAATLSLAVRWAGRISRIHRRQICNDLSGV